MNFEQKMFESNKKSTELEQVNQKIENSTDPEIKENLFQKAGSLEQALDQLEQQSGLSQEEILKNYQSLSEKVAKQGIKNVLKDLDEITKDEIEQELKQGVFSKLIEVVKNKFPDRMPAVVAYTLLFTVAGATPALSFEIGKAEIVPAETTIEQLYQKYSQEEIKEEIENLCTRVFKIEYKDNLQDMLSQIESRKHLSKKQRQKMFIESYNKILSWVKSTKYSKIYDTLKTGEKIEIIELPNSKVLVTIGEERTVAPVKTLRDGGTKEIFTDKYSIILNSNLSEMLSTNIR